MNTVLQENDISKKELIHIALKAFFNITNLWELTAEERKILLGLDKDSSVYFNWKRNLNGILSNDQLDRISYIVGIYKNLSILFTDKKQANEWIKKPNSAFNDKSALEVMLQGKIMDLALVRGYLDAQRGW